jgi:hypothetical protein
MADFSTSVGDGLEINLVISDDGNGKRSLIEIHDIGRDTSVALNNMEAMSLAAELISLSNVNDDGGGMSNAEALELHFLGREET